MENQTMASWQPAPPQLDRSRSYQLYRTPPTGHFKATILSEFPIGTSLHYWKGRTVPCDKHDCEACKAGHRPRWKGYIFAMSEATRRVIIFEYTERVHHEFEAFIATYGNCRGARIIARRTGKRVNSPLMVTFEDGRTDGALLPNPGNLAECLENMWEMRQQPLPNTDLSADDLHAPTPRLMA